MCIRDRSTRSCDRPAPSDQASVSTPTPRPKGCTPAAPATPSCSAAIPSSTAIAAGPPSTPPLRRTGSNTSRITAWVPNGSKSVVPTTDFDPFGTHAVILDVFDPVLRKGGVEGGPAAVAVELGIAAEQLGVAGAAGVHPLGLGVGVLTEAWSLGAGLSQDLVLRRGQLLTPLLVGLGQGIGTAVVHRGPPTQG